MKPVERLRVIKTAPASAYTGVLTTGQSEVETIAGMRADGRGSIPFITVRTMQRLSFTLEFLDYNYELLKRKSFDGDDASIATITGSEAGDFWYNTQQVDWANWEYHNSSSKIIRCRFINDGTIDKLAGTNGTVQIQIGVKR